MTTTRTTGTKGRTRKFAVWFWVYTWILQFGQDDLGGSLVRLWARFVHRFEFQDVQDLTADLIVACVISR